MRASIQETVDDGRFQLGQGQMEQMMSDMAAGFLGGQRATGRSLSFSLDSVMGNGSAQSGGNGNNNGKTTSSAGSEGVTVQQCPSQAYRIVQLHPALLSS